MAKRQTQTQKRPHETPVKVVPYVPVSARKLVEAEYPEGSLMAHRHTYFPQATWGELVAGWSTSEEDVRYALPPDPEADPDPRKARAMVVGTYAHCKEVSFRLHPTPELVTWVGGSMIRVDNDTLYWELVHYNPGSWLLLLKHNLILASRWLRRFGSHELPPELVSHLLGQGVADHVSL